MACLRMLAPVPPGAPTPPSAPPPTRTRGEESPQAVTEATSAAAPDSTPQPPPTARADHATAIPHSRAATNLAQVNAPAPATVPASTPSIQNADDVPAWGEAPPAPDRQSAGTGKRGSVGVE